MSKTKPNASDSLERYRTRRNFNKTPEPGGETSAPGEALSFVIQKHAARRLHYDFRLELDGVMRSWAVPKGPSLDAKDKRMAIQVEDHPVSYSSFEGTIPPGQYGAGGVIVWDRGIWMPQGDAHEGLEFGKLVFRLYGQKLAGLWELVRIAKAGDRQIAWILFKKHDAYERPRADHDVLTALPDSVIAKPRATASITSHAEASPELKSAREISGAVAGALPPRLKPQLATSSNGLPTTGDWTFEIKFDGYRLMTRIDEGGTPQLFTRGGHDWSAKMPALVRELRALDLRSCWLDGEIVVIGENGLPSFAALQRAFESAACDSITYFLFDLPFCDGMDLRKVPLRDRRNLLAHTLMARHSDHVRMSESFVADAADLIESARQLQLEGVVAKRGDASYVSARTETWLKFKVRLRQEFVVAGYTDRAGTRSAVEIGSLMLGVYGESGELESVGSVGTGWDAKTAALLKKRLLQLEVDDPPFAAVTVKRSRWSRRSAASERWVKPQLVVEVEFGEWTPDGQIRHATFKGVRADKPAREVQRDCEVAPTALPLTKGRKASGTRVSNPERVIDASTGLSKLDVVRYYESVAEWMVPHLKGRPCSLVRGPSGIAGELFFQKHLDNLRIPGVRELDPALWPDHAALLEVPDAHALAGAAQMNTIEFHTWNALARNLEKPDRMVFDLDPGEGVAWERVQEAAVIVREFLAELGLDAWLKTSGGKGLHVVVPLSPRHDWEAVKAFSRAFVQHLAKVIPNRYVAKSGPSNRKGKIFVDYLRNHRGATTAAAYSARARPGLGVSMPVPWEMLDTLRSGSHWTITTAREHLSFHAQDPWADYWTKKQSLTAARRRLLPS